MPKARVKKRGPRKVKMTELRRIARLQPSTREAAAFLGVTHKRFLEFITQDVKAKAIWEEGQQLGKISLRRKQMRLAANNASMAIFLGKQYLGQQDIVVNEVTGRGGGPITTMNLSSLSADERKHLRTILNRARKKS